MSDCQVGNYEKGGQCVQCSKQCLTCESESVCDSCANGFYFNPMDKSCSQSCPTNLYADPLNNKCVQVCPDGYYANDQLLSCLKCDPACGTCTDGTNEHCTSCNANMFAAFFPASFSQSVTQPRLFIYPDEFSGVSEYAVSGWVRW